MWSRKHLRLPCRGVRRALVLSATASLGIALPGAALLPPWFQHTVSGTTIEAALFRAMALPGLSVLFPRPAAESVSELNHLVSAGPAQTELLLLRSRQEESALDLAAAERDLKAYVAQSPTDLSAKLTLADFYHRRLAVTDEFATLLEVGSAPPTAGESFQNPTTQTAWQAFERALRLATDQSIPVTSFDNLWQHWIARYPQQPTVYARAFTWDLNEHRAAEAQATLRLDKQAFPADAIFPVKASALLALAAGGPDAQSRALAVYDTAFQPLWPAELVNSYFDLLAATHNTRRFVSETQARLQQNPDDLNAAARLFLYYRHDGHPDTALALLDGFRRSKEQRDPTGRNWSPEDLYALAQLCSAAQIYPEAARYDFALHNLSGKLADGRTARAAGLTGMISILLTAPDQPIALGASNLSMYRDMGTLDGGPGFWNGILSLWLNSQDIRAGFAEEQSKAQPYFHRREAAVLLKLLDEQAPSAPERPALHAQLIQVFADYGEDAALLHEGERFLQSFPNAPERTPVALAMADAHARAKDTAAEFALYDRLLDELGRAANNMPLSAAAVAAVSAPTPLDNSADASEPGDDTGSADTSGESTSAPASATHAFDLDTADPSPPVDPAATAYAQVLDRYLGRLTATNQLPQALAVLRKELDRNPNDPQLYERLANFLAQNNLSAQQEEVYRAAIGKFGDTSWYDKLARFYLREKRRDAFATLTRQVTDIFSGTDLETYFQSVRQGGPQLFLQLNLYAHKRFPHDLTFTNNLLVAYTSKPTTDRSDWERLLRESWWQSPELTTQFFGWLSQTGKLQGEIAQLEAASSSDASSSTPDTAAMTELAQADLWRSHFEQSSPLFDRLAELYPIDTTVGTTAADLNRSLAWLDPSGPAIRIARAVTVEQHLLSADAADGDRLTRVGDILADHADGTRASYAPAAVFWRRIPASAPGVPDSYLQAATVFWDYFQFDDALDQIGLARAHFHDPALFGYEAGAILEGKRDLPGAIQEYVRAALAGRKAESDAGSLERDRKADLNLVPKQDFDTELAADPSADRLLQLARRSATGALVDSATSAALSSNPSLPALRLRLAVLDAQHRNAEEQPPLLAAISRANTADAAAELAAFAQKQSGTGAYEAALEREAGLTPDPVEKLQLTYDLVRAYQARNDLQDAAHLVDATYRANPRLLGVVRFTVDFDWSNKRQKDAIAVLLEAGHAAQPKLMQSFTAEAAFKANASGDTALGRSLATTLLASEPYNPQFLSLAADSYAKANDIAGLQDFYRKRLDAIHTASLSADERKMDTALLRRGLIPALVTGQDYPAALDQYIALLSAFPEDNSLIREAALFALRYQQQDKLRSFYLQTTQSSPHDARFFVALAETDDLFGDPSGALEAYAHAVALRPERSELFIAKASLEERLQRFDAAVADYTRLFQLSYKDPQWMVAAAQAQARQGHTAAAVQALETGYLHGAQTTPHDLFTVAAQLEQWGMLAEAVTFAQRGAKAAGPDLLAGQPPSVTSDDAAVYARVLTRAHRTGEVFSTLHAALAGLDDTPSSLSTVAAQVRSTGLASVTDADWRRHYVQVRQERAQTQFTQAILAMSTAVATYGTPEDRAAYASVLSTQKAAATPDEAAQRWIPAARAADLGELEGSWRSQLLNSAAPGAAREITPYIELQETRLRFAELGATLERFARSHPKSDRHADAVLQAANAYATEGDWAAELHLLRAQRLSDPDNSSLRDTYLNLLAHRDTDALVALSGSPNEALADAAVATALAATPPSVALSAIRARGTVQLPVWTSSYTGLAGLYFGDGSPTIDTAFRQALAPDATIGERLSSHPDTQRQLTGDPWFYDAARYGQWRLLSPASAANAGDMLPADLEGEPTTANYLVLAQTESEAELVAQALADTAHALELSPASVDALDARAVLLWNAGRTEEAIACWRSALAALQAAEDKGPAPESFWTGFERIAMRIKQHGLFPQLQPAINDLLRSYLARNGSYRSNELLQAAFQSAPDETSGVNWLLALSGAAPDAAQVLQDLDGATWLSAGARQHLLSRELALLQAHQGAISTDDYEGYRLTQARTRLLQLDITTHRDAEALALIQGSPESVRSTPEFQRAELIAAARSRQLPALLRTYDTNSASVPQPETVRSAAAALAATGDWDTARALLEWTFTRAEATHTLSRSDSLTLAEARLHTHDNAGAVDLLRTFVAASDNRYTDDDDAATLLEQFHLAAESIPFLKELSTAVPWDLTYRVRLAEAQMDDGVERSAAIRGLGLVARNSLAPYPLRAQAARDLAAAHAQAVGLGSAELNLLASGSVSAALARQPFFVEARVTAAKQNSSPQDKLPLLREALAIAPHSPGTDKLRFQAFDLSAHAGQASLARTVLRLILAGQNAYAWPPQPPARSGLLQYLDLSNTVDAYSSSNTEPALPIYGQSLPDTDKAALAEEIARVYTLTADLPTAHLYLEFAKQLLPDDAKGTAGKARITADLNRLDEMTRLAAANAARRPAVRKQLDQPTVVRVRLTSVPPDTILPTTTEER